MSKDVVCVDDELYAASSNIIEYCETLNRIIEDYISIIERIQEDGIQDELICTRLNELIDSVQPYIEYINNEKNLILSQTRSYQTKIDEEDNFDFKENITNYLNGISSRI